MPFQLRTELDEGFWTHTATGEHADKHWSDFDEVAELSQAYGRGVVTDRQAFHKHLRTTDPAFEIVRHRRLDGSAGDIAGFAIADFNNNGADIRVNDLVVAPEYRGRGVGGFLMGRMVTQRRIMMHPTGAVVTYYGSSLTMPNGTERHLPGLHVNLYEADADEAAEARPRMPREGFSLLSYMNPEDETTYHELSQGHEGALGQIAVMSQNDEQYRQHEYAITMSDGSSFDGQFEHTAFAAIAALNRPDY